MSNYWKRWRKTGWNCKVKFEIVRKYTIELYIGRVKGGSLPIPANFKCLLAEEFYF